MIVGRHGLTDVGLKRFLSALSPWHDRWSAGQPEPPANAMQPFECPRKTKELDEI
jgi:hypothetical protein